MTQCMEHFIGVFVKHVVCLYLTFKLVNWSKCVYDRDIGDRKNNVVAKQNDLYLLTRDHLYVQVFSTTSFITLSLSVTYSSVRIRGGLYKWSLVKS
jgi:hypothetical protein